MSNPSNRPRTRTRTGGSGRPAARPSARTRKQAQRRRRAHRRRRWLGLLAAALTLVLVCAGVGVVYAATAVPLPGEVHDNQSSILYYSDGKTVLAKLGAENRTDVPLSDVPVDVQHAVVAAENRSFYTDPGISAKGIARAVWADVRGKDVQGGSTITQQYAKNAYLTAQRSVSRKLKEMVLAVKLDRAYSKDQILDWYLNTIYFGRGAYGIQAAAETYFGVPARRLSLAQGAVLASSIRSPALYDPQDHAAAATDRWHYVLSGMVEQGWLTPVRVAALRYPKVLAPHDTGFNDLSGPRGYIVRRVEEELAQQGISESELRSGGLRVVTTINRRAQRSAVAAVRQVFAGQPASLRQALVAVQPGTGAVRAYYGGDKGYGFYDYAAADYQSGSSIKAFVLASALEHGISVNSYWNGSSPQTFPDRPNKPVYNSGDGMGEQCPRCALWEATAESLNTVYYALTSKVGVANVVDLAARAGIQTINGQPAGSMANKVTNSFGIGQYEVTPLDMADGFATIGAAGMHYAPYFVQSVTRGADRSPVYAHPTGDGDRAFSRSTAADEDWTLQKVITQEAPGGLYDRRLTGPGGEYRPAGAKTGTTQIAEGRGNLGNKDAWFTGYTPQLAAAVWVGHDRAQPLVDATGREVYGIYLPGLVWRAFMQAALAGAHVRDFPPPVFKGSTAAGDLATAPPIRRPSPSPVIAPVSPSSSPSPEPTGSPSAPPPIEPSPAGSPSPSPPASPPVVPPASGAPRPSPSASG